MEKSQVWMSHADTILELPEGFELLATTESIPVAAFRKSRVNSRKSKVKAMEMALKTQKLRTHELSSLRFTVSSRSISFHRRKKNTKQLSGEYLRLQPGLDTGAFYYRYR